MKKFKIVKTGIWFAVYEPDVTIFGFVLFWYYRFSYSSIEEAERGIDVVIAREAAAAALMKAKIEQKSRELQEVAERKKLLKPKFIKYYP